MERARRAAPRRRPVAADLAALCTCRPSRGRPASAACSPSASRLWWIAALRFVDGEAQAEALDADSEDDVLALAPALDLRTLVEDELLLAWPIVPRHDAVLGTGTPGRRR